MGWFSLSVIAGILVGVGLIFARSSVVYGVPPYLFVGIMGFVYLVGSGTIAFIRGENLWSIAGYAILLGVIAALFFFIQNVLQYRAITMTPILTNIFLAITISAVFITLLYDVVRMLGAGSLGTINAYQIAALIAAIITLVLFRLAQ